MVPSLQDFGATLGAMAQTFFQCSFDTGLAGPAQVSAAADTTLLASAEAALVNWPSSCRNGTCRTCIGQLAHGAVRYDIAWPGLSAEEKVQGFVLPCVAFPCSDLALKR
jgi:ferredoxin